MRIITIKSRARGAAEKWKRIYSYLGSWHVPSKESDYRRLAALGPDPDPEDVNRIIGHAGWTSIHCDECGQPVEIAMVFWDGPEDDDESSSVELCLGCLTKAAEKLDMSVEW